MEENTGKRIKDLRGEETQQQLADALGVSRSLVAAWEVNDRPVRSDDLKKLAAHFGVTAGYILGISGTKSTNPNMQATADFTGLSEDAIEAIRKFRGNYQIDDNTAVPANELSEILSNELFENLIAQIEDLRFMSELVSLHLDIFDLVSNGADISNEQVRTFCEDFFDDTPANEDLTDEIGEKAAKMYIELKMQLYELSEAFSDLIEGIVPTKELVERGKKVYRLMRG